MMYNIVCIKTMGTSELPAIKALVEKKMKNVKMPRPDIQPDFLCSLIMKLITEVLEAQK